MLEDIINPDTLNQDDYVGVNLDMKKLTGKPHKFFARDNVYRNDQELRNWIDNTWSFLKQKDENAKQLIPGNAIKYTHENAASMQAFQHSYNFFGLYNEKMYDVLSQIREMTIEACEYYEIDYKRHNYHIAAWINYTHGPRVHTDAQISYDDHGSNPFEFHGYYSVDAEPGHTMYKVDDGELFPWENKNGTIMLTLNGYHHGVGSWPFEKPRITIAYNIHPAKWVPRDRDKYAQWLPLL